LYKKAQAALWYVERIDCSKDTAQFKNMPEPKRRFVKYQVAFFIDADGHIIDIVSIIKKRIQDPWAKAVMNVQIHVETIHNESYSIMGNIISLTPEEREEIFDAWSNTPFIKRKIDWLKKWVDDGETIAFARLVLAFHIAEGLFFTGSFCAFTWLKKNDELIGIGKFDEFISRDEALHTFFSRYLYNDLQYSRLEEAEVHEMMKDAVEIEKLFICDAIPVDLIGMNKEAMMEYIQHVADQLLVGIGYSKLYNNANPFPWMIDNAIDSKQNMFEGNVTEYQQGSQKPCDPVELEKAFVTPELVVF